MTSNRHFSNHAALFRLMPLAFVGLTACIVTWLFFVGWRFALEIPASAIYPESGLAYQIDLRVLQGRPFVGWGDSVSALTVSTAVLREDANPLGPGHSLHQEIRDLGGGRFSHWGNGLIFSSTDNTDPRANSRKYVVEISLYLPFYYVLLAAALLAGIVVANRREVAQAARAAAMSWHRRFSNYAALFRLTLLAFAGLAACIVTWLFFVGWRFALEIPAPAIYPESGLAYEIDPRVLKKKGPLLGRGDSISAPTVSTAVLREGANRLGPAHSPHKEIRDLGSGRFSHWGERLVFSASDNADPRANSRKYVMEVSFYLPFYYVLLAAGVLATAVIANRREVARAARVGRSLVIHNRRVQRTWENVAHNRVLRWTRENVIPPFIGTLAVLLAIAVIGEAYFRITTPFAEVKWPVRFDPRIGFLFEPNAELRYTNHLDFWVSERTNSLGFADRELNSDMLRHGCRVVFIGDSMVEAAQVRNDEKVQAVLEKKAAGAHPEWQLTASAFGYSGTGQLNQITFYDSFVHNLRPKLVVLVFAGNDFANNSSVLESLRNGWHPDHPPRLFARRDPRTGAYHWIQIDPDWERYVLKTETQPNGNNQRQRVLHSFMKEHSLFYGWLWRKLSPFYPEIVSRLEGGPTLPELIAMRMEAVRGIHGEYRRQLRDWDNSYNADLDAVFYDKELSELLSEALNLTGFALSEFQRRVKQHGGHLVILTTSQMSLPRVPRRPDGKQDPLFSRRAFLRLEAIARTLRIPVIDQYNYIMQNGGNLLAAQFRHDAHWTPQGHVWASEAVLKYLEQNPQICRPQ